MADAEAVATLSAITGLPAAEAEGFLEMAGGDLDSATALFFSMQEGGGPVAEPGAAADALGFEPPDWYTLVWPALEP